MSSTVTGFQLPEGKILSPEAKPYPWVFKALAPIALNAGKRFFAK